ncbi:MutS domain V [Chitinophaga costaii]|uniref:MutS domain V n=1 Tax=Chitinophaga costaii TaxID=1335309 RepID=A0A1C4F6P7_9BACT|nr:hypothetical protein [Chitinophaga costaii]PUZ21248.1 hypothetical protein DCM91_17050 [Chitinophaga costaii]SCC51462.1 MutS domain V [Chitinophaga costaii]
MQPTIIYEQKIGEIKVRLADAATRMKWLSFIRLLAFAAAVACVYKCFGPGAWLLAPVGVVAALVIFAYSLRRYQHALQYEALQKALLQLNEKELHLVLHHESRFDDGQAFSDEQHAFSGDLDLFGPASLYQHLNRTGTLSGSEQLASMLKMPLQQAAAITDVQDVVKDLAPKLDFRQLLAAQGSLTGEKAGDHDRLKAWLAMPLYFLPNKGLNILRFVSLVLTLTAIAVTIVLHNFYPLMVMLGCNTVLLVSIGKKVIVQHHQLGSQEKILYRFAEILLLIRNESFTVGGLQSQQEQAREADVALRKLARISSALDQRNNLLVPLFLGTFFLYDLHCAYALEKWKAQYRDQVPEWLAVIAQMEAWNSLATFAYNHPTYAYPVLNEAEKGIVAAGLCHPLIAPEACVKNDCVLTGNTQFLIITGSNMSGKSTFLRSVGANLVLAMCGAPVGADSFLFAPMEVMTSMRIKDSIAKHTSYFQAELLRLQQIVFALQKGQRVFIILDEILKGTNSEDKLSGSRKLVEQFLQYNCLGMIATHDLELGQLESTHPQQVKNYCFESTISDAGLFFDYRIRKGIARNKNATFLMEQLGII